MKDNSWQSLTNSKRVIVLRWYIQHLPFQDQIQIFVNIMSGLNLHLHLFHFLLLWRYKLLLKNLVTSLGDCLTTRPLAVVTSLSFPGSPELLIEQSGLCGSSLFGIFSLSTSCSVCCSLVLIRSRRFLLTVVFPR